jgi:hypothetical protein
LTRHIDCPRVMLIRTILESNDKAGIGNRLHDRE